MTWIEVLPTCAVPLHHLDSLLSVLEKDYQRFIKVGSQRHLCGVVLDYLFPALNVLEPG